MLNQHPEHADHGERVPIDTPCVNCNYNLRSCELAGTCPECGTPVAHSGIGVSMEHADERWLRRVALGAHLLIGAACATVVVGAMATAVAVTGGLPSNWWSSFSGLGGGIVPSAIWLLWQCVLASWVAGVVFITAREPRLRFEESPVCLRCVLRVTAPVLVLAAGGHAGEALHVLGLSSIAGRWGHLLSPTAGVLLVALVGFHVSMIAKRSGMARLHREMLGTTGLVVLCSILVILSELATTVLGWHSIILTIVDDYGLVHIPLALCVLCYAVVLNGFRRAAIEARQSARFRAPREW